MNTLNGVLSSRGYDDNKLEDLRHESIKNVRLLINDYYDYLLIRDIQDISKDYNKKFISSKRAKATVIDYAFLLLIFVLLVIGSRYIDSADPAYLFIAILIIYFPVCEWFYGKTLGKKIVKISIVDKSGNKPSPFQALIRFILRIIEVNPYILGCLPAFTFVFLTKRRQRFGDLMARTYVVCDFDLKIHKEAKVKILI